MWISIKSGMIGIIYIILVTCRIIDKSEKIIEAALLHMALTVFFLQHTFTN